MACCTIDVRLENPGGLTGVWAEENTRASLWDAMYRKETFGVSGPHIDLGLTRFTDKITPILDSQQQQEFQTIRDDVRRRLIEKMASQVLETLEADVKQKLERLE